MIERFHNARGEKIIKNNCEVQLILGGRIDREAAPALLNWICTQLSSSSSVKKVEIDLASVEYLDSAGVAILAEALELAKEQKCKLTLVRISDPAQQTLAMFRFHDIGKSEQYAYVSRGIIENLGDWLVRVGHNAEQLMLLTADIFYWACVGPFVRTKGAPKEELIRQAILLGSRAFGIIALLATLVGLTLTLLSANQLRQFGANIFVADLVVIAMVREIGPLIAAIIVAGRSGSAIAAEIATMEITEEVDALAAMGFSPIRFLVVPKLYTVTFTQPLLTVVAEAFGISGGMIVGMWKLGLPIHAYLQEAGDALQFDDLYTGLFKSLVFGWIILIVAAYSGLGTRGGAGEVGISTTKSVVLAIFAVIIADCIFSLIFYL